MLNTVRHDEVFSYHNAWPVTIIGCGALGSRIFRHLVELGVRKIQLIDYDDVEEHNLCNQIFERRHVGMPKVEACLEWAAMKGADTSKMGWYVSRGEHLGHMNPIVFLMVDSMAARSRLSDHLGSDVTTPGGAKPLYVIEGRMASSYGNIYSLPIWSDIVRHRWEGTFTSDEVAEVSACGTSLTVGATAEMLASMAAWEYIRLCNDEDSIVRQKIRVTNFFLNPVLIVGTQEM